jgi:hypothetical protein
LKNGHCKLKNLFYSVIILHFSIYNLQCVFLKPDIIEQVRDEILPADGDDLDTLAKRS